MKKLIGSIIIMLILTQPMSTESAYNIKTVSVHIFQESKDFATLNMIKENDEEEELPTIDDLSDNMDLVTNLLTVKNETVATIQNTMNEKVKSRTAMNEEQIVKFQEFIKFTENKNAELQAALKQIDSKKDLKVMQQAVLQNNINYDKLAEEILDIKQSQDIAISSLTGIISFGNGVLDII